MASLDNTFYINTSSISVLIATGSLLGTSSYASTASILIGTVTSASYASTSSAATSITFVPSTASFSTTSSAATSITFIPASSSYTTTASYYKISPNIKSGKISASAFVGNPLTYSVNFNTAYSSPAYSVSINGGDARILTAEQVSASSFIISTNSTIALTDYVYWMSVAVGESS